MTPAAQATARYAEPGYAWGECPECGNTVKSAGEPIAQTRCAGCGADVTLDAREALEDTARAALAKAGKGPPL